MADRQRKVRIFLSVVLGAVVSFGIGLVLFVPVRFPSTVSTFATITPASRWVLAKAADGQLISSTFNYRTGMSEGFRVSTFNQGSSVYFALSPALAPGGPVAIGDTIATIYSTDVAERLIALNGQLATARGALAVNATGQKTAIVAEAEQRHRFAIRRREEHRLVERRTQLLMDQHLIPQGEYDRVQSEANALQDQISIEEASLESARTGAKPEQLDLAHANIAALQGEIDAVKRRASALILTAPISGTVSPTYSGDTLLAIAAKEYIALIPIRRTDYLRVAATPGARVTLTGLSELVRGKLVYMNRELQMMDGREVFIAVGQLNSPPTEVMPGMLVRCSIHCTPATAADLGRQLVRMLAASRPLLGVL